MNPAAQILQALHPKLPLKLLFLCTHNRCRSILAEAITREVGGNLLRAASAGSEPAGAVDAKTLHSLERHGISAQGLRSKALDALEGFDPDFVITMCHKNEACPIWPGKNRPLYWGLPDPSLLEGSEADSAFDKAIDTLTTRLRWLRAGVEQGLNHQGLVMLISALADPRAGAPLHEKVA
jgi:arsenate reductase